MKHTMNLEKLMKKYRHDKPHFKEHKEELDLPKIILPCSIRYDLKKINDFQREHVEFHTSFMFTLRIKLSITPGILDKN